MIGQFLFDAVEVRLRFIHLIDGDDNGNVRRFRMVDRLHSLRHDAVVRGDHEHDDIRDGGAARAHRRKCFMPRRIEEGDRLPLYGNGISADMLRDAARFTRRNVRTAYFVEQRGLAVIDVAHDRDDGRTHDGAFVAGGLAFVDFVERFLGGLFGFVFEFYPEIVRYIRRRIVINGIVDGLCDAFLEQAFGDLHRRDPELFAQNFQRNVLTGNDGVLDLDGLHRLLFLLFDAQFPVSALILVKIGYGNLLFHERTFADRAFLLAVRLFIRSLFLGRRRICLCRRCGRNGCRIEPAGRPCGISRRRTGPRGARGGKAVSLNALRLRAAAFRRGARGALLSRSLALRGAFAPPPAFVQARIDIGGPGSSALAAIRILRADDLFLHPVLALRDDLRRGAGRRGPGCLRRLCRRLLFGFFLRHGRGNGRLFRFRRFGSRFFLGNVLFFFRRFGSLCNGVFRLFRVLLLCFGLFIFLHGRLCRDLLGLRSGGCGRGIRNRLRGLRGSLFQSSLFLYTAARFVLEI